MLAATRYLLKIPSTRNQAATGNQAATRHQEPGTYQEPGTSNEAPRGSVESASDELRVDEARYGRRAQLSENGDWTRACRRERGDNDHRATGNDGEFPIQRHVTVALDARDVR